MSVLDTKHKRKSALITACILALLIFGIFNYGMRYLDPPEEYGLAINFGSSEVGSGAPIEKVNKVSEPTVVEQQEVVEEEVKEVQKEVVQEEVITSDTSKEVPVVEKEKEIKKEPVKKVEKEIEKKEIPKPKPKPKPKPSKETQDALNNLLNGNASNGKPKGEGDDEEAGIKGKKNGDASATKYYGNTGSGSGGNYNLAGRKALSKPKEQPDCEEEGTVVVQIQVDRNGKVVYAKAGVQGTTNSNPCLLKPAKQAALKTKWSVSTKAPANQVGTIIYKFSLSK